MTKTIILLATISFLSSCRTEMKTLNYNAISCSCPQSQTIEKYPKQKVVKTMLEYQTIWNSL